MSGDQPATGARFVLTRCEVEDAAAIIYRGHVHLPAAMLPLEVRVELPGGATRATLEGGTRELESQAGALVRAATKSAVADGVAPPRKIVRWRP